MFPTDESVFKMLYLAMIDITKKWTGRRQDWSVIHAQMARFYADRMGCQLAMSTHSPFFLAIPGAKIYALDANPVDIKS